MQYWANYYEKLFNFREIRYFDIKGEYTGLLSRAMTAPDGKIRIPLNEESTGGGQIEEFLMAYNGEGIQHIAFACDDILAAWDKLKSAASLSCPSHRPPTIGCWMSACPGTANRSRNSKAAAYCSTAVRRRRPRLLLQISPPTCWARVLRVYPAQG